MRDSDYTMILAEYVRQSDITNGILLKHTERLEKIESLLTYMYDEQIEIKKALIRHEEHFEKIDLRIEQLVDRMDVQFTQANNRLASIDSTLQNSNKAIVMMLERMEAMETRQERFESSVAKLTDAMMKMLEYQVNYSQIEQRLAKLENAIQK